MKLAVIGLGVQGLKRCGVAKGEVRATVDPLVYSADFQDIKDVPLDLYDAACVCTSDQVKLPIILYLLTNHKHVLVEKPLLSLNDIELAQIKNIAEANEVAIYTAYNHRFEPNISTLRQALSEGILGKIYYARLFYGNGTSMDIKNSPWKDQGNGVLYDLGSHLVDISRFLFQDLPGDFKLFSGNRFETNSFDHVLLGCGTSPFIELEATYLSWRNAFTIDVYGEYGSAHVEGLCKWGPSTYTLRSRIFPSGIPTEDTRVISQPDPTWHLEYEHFIDLCKLGQNNLENDIWINTKFKRIGDCNQTAEWL